MDKFLFSAVQLQNLLSKSRLFQRKAIDLNFLTKTAVYIILKYIFYCDYNRWYNRISVLWSNTEAFRLISNTALALTYQNQKQFYVLAGLRVHNVISNIYNLIVKYEMNFRYSSGSISSAPYTKYDHSWGSKTFFIF